MTREELNKQIKVHQDYAMQLAQILAAVDDEPEDQREGLLEDVWFLSLFGTSEVSMYLHNKKSRWPRLLAGVFGEGTKSVGSDGLDVLFKKAPIPLTVKSYLSPNCHIVTEESIEEKPVMTEPEETGETRTVTKTRTRVVCDRARENLCGGGEMKYAIDLPDTGTWGDAWINFNYYATKEEALDAARNRFGADAEGRINIISELSDEGDY